MNNYPGNFLWYIGPLLVPGEPARDLGTKNLGTLVGREIFPWHLGRKKIWTLIPLWKSSSCQGKTLAGRLYLGRKTFVIQGSWVRIPATARQHLWLSYSLPSLLDQTHQVWVKALSASSILPTVHSNFSICLSSHLIFLQLPPPAAPHFANVAVAWAGITTLIEIAAQHCKPWQRFCWLSEQTLAHFKPPDGTTIEWSYPKIILTI